MRSHYDVLGVHRGATAVEIRSAYRAKARLFHPDRHIDGSPAEQERAASQMQELNEAWRVVGDPALRARYDAAQSAPTSEPRTWTAPADEEGAELDLHEVEVATNLIRLMPLVLLLGVLAVIFVFTAFATSGSDRDDPPGSTGGALLGQCLQVDSGPVTTVVPCDRPNDGQVVVETTPGGACPRDTNRLAVPGSDRAVCLAPT